MNLKGQFLDKNYLCLEGLLLKPVSSSVATSAGWSKTGVALLAAGNGSLSGVAIVGGTAENWRSGGTVEGGWNSKGTVRSSVSR